MSDQTKIQWADATFNPWIGCTKVSPGCKNCYAENTTRARVLRSQGQETWGKGAKRSRTSAATWKQPLKWNRDAAASGNHPRIFPSLCDWLDDEVPVEWLADFLKLIHDTPNLDWLLLTKRPENWNKRAYAAMDNLPDDLSWWLQSWAEGTSIPQNIWLGTSVENQAMADKRIPELLKIPAKIRFLSVEPMLEKIDLKFHMQILGAGKPLIDWTIFGGESGHNARPCNIDWIRDGVKQCKAAGTKVFVKQLGANITKDLSDVIPQADENSEPEDIAAWEHNRHNVPVSVSDPKGGDMNEWPQDLRIREMPLKRIK